MRIIVLNLHRHRFSITALKLICILLIGALLGLGFINYYTSSDAYAEALAIESEKNLIIIDAGHGGEDSGAIGSNGVYEKDLNLEIANSLGEELKKEGFAVLYTRTTDKLLYSEDENIKGLRKISDLKNRCKIAAEHPNAIFVSIHMNSYGNSKYSGLQVYYSENDKNSYTLATKIQSTVKETVQPENNRVIKNGKGIYVLENNQNVCVLIECGFITNPDECKNLSEKEYQKRLCSAIVCGIIDYKETIAK